MAGCDIFWVGMGRCDMFLCACDIFLGGCRCDIFLDWCDWV